MPRNKTQAKLRTLIRKLVKEEMEKELRSQDPRFVSSPHETFDLDPRFSTGHYTVEREPFPHDEQPLANKQSKKHMGHHEDNAQSGFAHEPIGLFGPMSPDDARPPTDRRSDGWPSGPPSNEREPFSSMPPVNGARRSGRGRTP